MKLKIEAYQEGDHYCAHILGGWWFAIGKTKKDAIKKVKDRFEKELFYFYDHKLIEIANEQKSKT